MRISDWSSDVCSSDLLETCATLGMLSGEQAGALKAAGLDYYNHNIDTDPEFYGDIIHTREMQDRFDTLGHVRDAGMKTCCGGIVGMGERSEEHTSELQSLMRNSYAVFCLKKKTIERNTETKI